MLSTTSRFTRRGWSARPAEARSCRPSRAPPASPGRRCPRRVEQRRRGRRRATQRVAGSVESSGLSDRPMPTWSGTMQRCLGRAGRAPGAPVERPRRIAVQHDHDRRRRGAFVEVVTSRARSTLDGLRGEGVAVELAGGGGGSPDHFRHRAVQARADAQEHDRDALLQAAELARLATARSAPRPGRCCRAREDATGSTRSACRRSAERAVCTWLTWWMTNSSSSSTTQPSAARRREGLAPPSFRPRSAACACR